MLVASQEAALVLGMAAKLWPASIGELSKAILLVLKYEFMTSSSAN